MIWYGERKIPGLRRIACKEQIPSLPDGDPGKPPDMRAAPRGRAASGGAVPLKKGGESVRRQMKRKPYIYTVLLILTVLLLGPGPMKAQAARSELVTLDAARDIVVIFTYDSEAPAVSLTDPSGKVYAAEADFAAVRQGDHAVYYYLKEAAAGTWYVDYDKKSNQELDVHVMPWYAQVTVQSIVMEPPAEDRITVRASVTAEEAIYYDFYLYAVTMKDGVVDGKKLLDRGSAAANQELERQVDISELPDGSAYYLLLEAVVTDENGTEMTAAARTENTFSVAGHLETGAPSELVTILDYTQNSLEIDWSRSEVSCSGWIVGVFQGDAAEPVYYDTLEREITRTEINVDSESAADIRVELTAMDGERAAVRYEREIPWETGVTVSIDTPETTSDMAAVISYDTGEREVEAEIRSNEKSQKLRWTGSGQVSFALPAMETQEIQVLYGWEEGSYYRICGRVSADTIPPALELFGIAERIQTDAGSITFSGMTEAGASLEINGSGCSVEEDGSFQATVELQSGENQVLFTAADESGNKTSRTVVVVRSGKGTAAGGGQRQVPGLLIYLAVLAASLLTAVIMGLCGMISGQKNAKTGRRLLAAAKGFCVCGIILSLLGAAQYVYRYIVLTKRISGKNLPGMLEASPLSDITGILEERQECLRMLLAPGLLAAGFLLVLILLIVLGKTAAKRNRRRRDPETGGGRERGPQKLRPGAVRNCPHCGAENPKNSRFCMNCGGDLKK